MIDHTDPLDTLNAASAKIAQRAEAAKHTPEPWQAVVEYASNTVGIVGCYNPLGDNFTLAVEGSGVPLFHSSDPWRVMAWLQGRHYGPRLAALERAAEVLQTVERTVFDQPLNRPARKTWTIDYDLGCTVLDALAALDKGGDA